MELIPGYRNYPAQFKVAVPYLIAAAIKHFDFIDKNFGNEHKIRNTSFWRNSVLRNRLSEHICGGLINSPGDPQMKATGIHAVTMMLKKLHDLQSTVEEIANGGASNLQMNEMITDIKSMKASMMSISNGVVNVNNDTPTVSTTQFNMIFDGPITKADDYEFPKRYLHY